MRRLGWILFILVASASIARPIVDPDLWWHLTVGRWIISHGEIPNVDYWNLFSAGKPWIAYSWSVEILFSFIQNYFGDKGLFFLYLFIGIIFIATLALTYGALAKNYFLGLLIAVLVACSAESHFTLRPQSITWILFVLVLYIADKIQRDDLDKKSASALFGIGCLWANMHLSSIFGFVGIAFWLAGRGTIVRAALCSGIFLLGTLVTPHLGAEWITAASKSSHPALFSSIIEFGPATIFHYSIGLLLVLLGLFLAILHYEPKTVSPFKIFFVGVTVFGGLAIIKFLPYGMIALGMLVSKSIGEVGLSRLGNVGEALQKLENFSSKSIEGNGSYFLLTALLIVRVGTILQKPVDYDLTPKAAVEFVKEKQLSEPILNGFGEGGFLIYSFSNEKGEPIFKFPIDGRTNVPPQEVLDAFFEAYQGGRKWQTYIDLVKPETIIFRNESPFVPIILASGIWCEVFQKGKGMGGYGVYLRREQANQRKLQCLK